tara:strand:+ start:2015 stop:2458 length:444 start_codon:yes stop_codon:yes gene_type:complete
MAVTYDKISFPKIENGLKKIIDDEFQNVYVSPRFKMIGNECIRVDLQSSSDLQKTTTFEEREYAVMLRYYFKGDLTNPRVNEAIKDKSDRLRRHLLNNQVVETASASWVDLVVQNIEFNIEDSENEDDESLYIIEYDLLLINFNSFG